jgi:hypothetical protein
MRNQNKSESGASSVEFAFIVLTLVPLLLGAGVVGVNLIRTLQTEQLARDAGHMFARGVDFSATGNQQILANIGSSVNMSTTAGSGNAVVILSALTYVDKSTCGVGHSVDASGNPSGCTNIGKWVFTRRLTVGNSGIHASSMGTPTGVTISPSGYISATDYCTKPGAVAIFSSINPYSNVAGTVTGLPSGQMLYIAEASATGYSLAPYGTASTYAFGLF